jgi:hypothetical protein
VRRDPGAEVPAATSPVRFPSPAIVAGVTIMSRFVAPLTFTIAAAWVLVLFVLVHGNS